MCSNGVLPRTPVHEDGCRDHDAPLKHLVLCDTGCNRSWCWCTRRCEVIRIGDRDYADQIRVIQVDENSNAWSSGSWIPRHRFRSDGERVRLDP